MNRRKFIINTGLATAAAMAGMPKVSAQKPRKATITLEKALSNFEREPLLRPFGFKGGYMSEIWQTYARLYSSDGKHATGLCTQNVLWSDAQVFQSFSESGGNATMYAMTDYALKLMEGKTFESPIELLDEILDEVYAYGQKVTGNEHLRKTFALNALVGVDNAAWLLYAKTHNINTFEEMTPEAYKPALSHRHDKVASIPLMAYSIPISEIKEAADDGYFFMKIKIGQPGTQAEMLEKDKKRLSAIHKAIGKKETPYTKSGKLPYYFDANGRYESKETLLQLLDHADKIGALDQIAVIEEPFPEEAEITVGDIGLRIAADESAHTDEDALKRIEMGYNAIALKPIAKTMSMTMKIAQAAHERNVPCFCADLTVNPVLVEWNKAVAARLAPFPGLGGIGLVETNGHQNYKNWEKMRQYHPYPNADWAKTQEGVFELGADYYAKQGGIFEELPYFDQFFPE